MTKALEIGRVCIKIAGREAGQKCVILTKPKKTTKGEVVLIDGPNVKRKECNVTHIEPLPQTVKVTKTTKTEDVVKLLT